ncbi:hypothetical protein EDC04DRAFT_2879204 [Pisolithus marmoratus]|nr:hypothetical protein EDC04DRAFT_2879204 [Pisolithus marmoratus]
MSLPKLMSGFTVIPVAYPHSMHILYAKAHASSSKSTKPTFPPNRTLFLINVPVDAMECELSLFFRYTGMVEQVLFDQNELGDPELQGDTLGSGSGSKEDSDGPDSSMEVDTEGNTETQHRKSCKDKKRDEPAPPAVVPLPTNPHHTLCKMGAVAHLVFLDSSSLTKALVPPQRACSWPSSEELRGLARYHSTYHKGEAIVDEDGFTLVTHGGAYGKTLFQATSKTCSKKKEPKEKTLFYAFQKAEKQQQAIMDLKKNFKADKA